MIIKEAKIKKNNIPDLYSQLAVVAKELENLEKLSEFSRKQLKTLARADPSTDQLQTIAESNMELKQRQVDLENTRREVKNLENKNKGVENRLNEYSKKGKQKSADTHSQMMKDAVAENKNLKRKIEDLEDNEKKKQEWMVSNYEDTKDLERRWRMLPMINPSRNSSRERSSVSMSKLDKLQKEKKIYHKWFRNYIPKNNDRVEEEIEDFGKIFNLLGHKISTLKEETAQFEGDLRNYKEKITPGDLEKARATMKKDEESKKKLKSTESNCDIRPRESRRDWIGRFDGLRFSDSRHIREETRVFRVVHTNVGYYQFSYYLVKNPEKTFTCPLPFDVHSALKGKESTFTVEHPDFIQGFKLRINPRTSKIFGMEVTSNLGQKMNFLDALEPPKKQKDKGGEEEDSKGEMSYTMKMKSNEAPTLMFGSYASVYDEKKSLIGVHLQGLGMELIENYVEEAM